MIERSHQARRRSGWKIVAGTVGIVLVFLVLLTATENIQDTPMRSITQQTYWFWDLIVKAVLFIGAVGTAAGAIIQMKKNRDEREKDNGSPSGDAHETFYHPASRHPCA
jgi:putative copper export protein